MNFAIIYPSWFLNLTKWLEMPGMPLVWFTSCFTFEHCLEVLVEMAFWSHFHPEVLHEISNYWWSSYSILALKIFYERGKQSERDPKKHLWFWWHRFVFMAHTVLLAVTLLQCEWQCHINRLQCPIKHDTLQKFYWTFLQKCGARGASF